VGALFRCEKHQPLYVVKTTYLFVIDDDADNDDDDDDNNKPVWPLGLWAPSSEGSRDVSTSITYVVKTTYPFVIGESGYPRQGQEAPCSMSVDFFKVLRNTTSLLRVGVDEISKVLRNTISLMRAGCARRSKCLEYLGVGFVAFRV
jgi:hypothetical protein